MRVAVAVRVDEVADLWQELLHQHRLVQPHAVLGLLKRVGHRENRNLIGKMLGGAEGWGQKRRPITALTPQALLWPNCIGTKAPGTDKNS